MPGNKRIKLTHQSFGEEIDTIELETRETGTVVDIAIEPMDSFDENDLIEEEDEVVSDELTDEDKLKALLVAWDSIDFWDNLRRCGFNYRKLKYLRESDYVLLLRNDYSKLADMTVFRHFHEQWKSSMMDPKPEDKTVDVKEVLRRGGKSAKEIQRFFSSNHYLTDALRGNLIRLVLKEKRQFSRPELNNIADQFVMIFPGELKHIYYNKEVGKNPTGLLFSEYNKTRTKKALAKLNEENTEESIASIDCLLTDDVQASIKFLNSEENVDEAEDASIIIDHWNNTFEYRDKKAYDNAEDYVNDWLPLQKSDGCILVDMDFVKGFGSECAQSLKNRWDDFSFDNNNLMAEACGDPIQKQNILGALSEDDVNVKDRKMVMALHHLSYLMPQKVTTTLTWTPAILQSKISFFRTVRNEHLIPAEMSRRKSFGIGKGIAAHPMIFEISNKSKYVVAIGQAVYECKSFIDAIDVAFKTFVVMKIPFPPECFRVWLFFNEFFYKLNLKQKPTVKMLSMVSSYKQ